MRLALIKRSKQITIFALLSVILAFYYIFSSPNAGYQQRVSLILAILCMAQTMDLISARRHKESKKQLIDAFMKYLKKKDI